MGDRTTRFWVAVLLTGMDIAVYVHFFGAIWQVFSGVGPIRVALLLTHVVWTGSAAVLWLHVYYDLRLWLHERRNAFAFDPPSIPSDVRRESDV
jgi:hypothetical protein